MYTPNLLSFRQFGLDSSEIDMCLCLRDSTKPMLHDNIPFDKMVDRVTDGHYIPDLGLLLGLGGWHDAGPLGGLLLGPGLAVLLALPVAVCPVLGRGAGKALGAHDPWDVLLPSLAGLGDGLRDDSVRLLLLVVLHRLHRLLLR